MNGKVKNCLQKRTILSSSLKYRVSLIPRRQLIDKSKICTCCDKTSVYQLFPQRLYNILIITPFPPHKSYSPFSCSISISKNSFGGKGIYIQYVSDACSVYAYKSVPFLMPNSSALLEGRTSLFQRPYLTKQFS